MDNGWLSGNRVDEGREDWVDRSSNLNDLRSGNRSGNWLGDRLGNGSGGRSWCNDNRLGVILGNKVPRDVSIVKAECWFVPIEIKFGHLEWSLVFLGLVLLIVDHRRHDGLLFSSWLSLSDRSGDLLWLGHRSGLRSRNVNLL